MRKLAIWVAALAAFLLVACGEATVRGDLPLDEPDRGAAPEPQLDTAGGLPETGRRLADLVRSRYPDAQMGRLALVWNRNSPWMIALGRGFCANWPSCLLGDDLGISARSAEESYIQLDPGNFARLLWVEPLVSPSGDLSGLSIDLRTLGAGPTWSASIPCRPALALGPRVPREQTRQSLAEPWATYGEAPGALLWEPSAPRLWAAFSGRIARLDFATRKTLQEWNLPGGEGQGGPARAILVDVSEDSSLRLGWFDLDRAQGRIYEKAQGDLFEAAETTDAFPLTSRVRRFLTAPFDSESRQFVLTDFKGSEMARCVDMVRFAGPDGSLFGLVNSNGLLTVLKGGDLGLLNGPISSPVSAVASAGSVLLVSAALPPYEVKGYRLNNRGAWTEIWSSPHLPAPAVALCAGGPEGTPSLFVSLRTDSGGAVYALPLPLPPSP